MNSVGLQTPTSPSSTLPTENFQTFITDGEFFLYFFSFRKQTKRNWRLNIFYFVYSQNPATNKPHLCHNFLPPRHVIIKYLTSLFVSFVSDRPEEKLVNVIINSTDIQNDDDKRIRSWQKKQEPLNNIPITNKKQSKKK